MTKHHYFFTALLSIATQLCWAMENKLPISRPTSIICFPNNIVAIAGQEGCCLYNFATQEILKTLNETPYPSISAHPNKTKLAILSNKNVASKDLTIYDLPTGNKIWQKSVDPVGCPPAFNPLDDTVVIRSGWSWMHSFNYTQDVCQKYKLGLKYNPPKIAFHPTKSECISYSYNALDILSTEKDYYSTKKTFPAGVDVNGYLYSPDGSLVIINNCFKGSTILDPESGKTYPLTNEKTCALLFHPSSFIMAILSHTESTLSFRNAKNQLLITTMPLVGFDCNYSPSQCPCPAQCMDFFCDGTKLIVAGKSKCIVLEVPFEALYKNLTKNRCIFTSLILHNYLCGDGNALPRDITHVIIKYLLATSKYSLTNY